MVIVFNPAGQVITLFGRKAEAVEGAPPPPGVTPPPAFATVPA